MAVLGINQTGQAETAVDYLQQLEAEKEAQCVLPSAPPAADAEPEQKVDSFTPPNARPDSDRRLLRCGRHIPCGPLGKKENYIPPKGDGT